MAIPKAMQDIYDVIMPWIHDFCQEHLDTEYEAICLRLLEKLCRKRPSPLLRGRPKSWAAGIVYEIASLNFIFDKANPYHMAAEDIASAFDVAKSTASNKAAEIRELTNLSRLDPQWMIPSLVERNPMVWMLSVNGFLVDIRTMPREVQQIAFDKGLIPFLPEEGGEEV